MPAIHTKTIRTIRNIWDEERRAMATKPKQEPAVFLRSRRALGKQTEEGLALQSFSAKNLGGRAKTKKYFLEHLELKKVAMDFLPDYQRYLGEGGFTKI